MNILLRQVLIADASSPLNGQTQDILIEQGVITAIEPSIAAKDGVQEISAAGLTASAGWVDLFAHLCDPGIEYRETLESGAAAAAAGGYTEVFVLPNTQPVVHNKTQVEYIVQKSNALPVTLRPLGAVTKGIEGKELAEMYDMQNSGAIAFSDGIYPVQSPGLLLKALQYVKAFNGVVIQVPADDSIGKYGLMHEGIISTQLGLPGIPALAEELMVHRDIELLRYTGSQLHITGVSTENSLRMIAAAKAEGLQITCSATPYHVSFCDEDLQTYDTNLKVTPPLRSRADMLALREAVKSGVVDCIASHHIPQNWDHKTCEFEYAKAGMAGLQTAFAAVLTAIPGLSAERIAQLFGGNARSVFALEPATVQKGATANITLFSTGGSTTLSKQNNKSKSYNTPFLDKALKGQVIGIIHKGQLHLNK
ncbi:dihydroorotase [Deminuibacter soli]|uniref:Dihydroorotase n=1 Tax=Deminuibacter soli TaxID=2291815 RepID=A0A3E1NC92_9BACT|nr:dihydroorotase [Deminuibacter soli]RFM25639.1 dihydroorotase [Deminuibacter soli]